MSDATFEAVIRRDRMIAAAALVLLTAMSWAYVLWLVDAMSMGGMKMPGMRMDANPFGVAMIPSLKPWSVMEFVFMFLMWAIMMVGMMTPSAAPMILIYARVGREAKNKGNREPQLHTSPAVICWLGLRSRWSPALANGCWNVQAY